MTTLYNDDCFNVFPKIEDKSVDLFVLDLPYANKKFGNCTACAWDTPIDLEKMWKEIKRIMKPNATIVHFCNTKFGFALIESNPKWFRYDLIWKKSRKVGFLSANKMPLRQHENIYIFKDNQGTYNPQKTEGKPYNCKQGQQTNLYGIEDKDKVITKNKGDRHPTSIIEFEPDHENVYIFKDKQGTYNPQKTEGKPYSNGGIHKDNLYGEKHTEKIFNKKGVIERHPTSIIEFEPNHENLYIFKDNQGTYNPQKTEGKPYTCIEGNKNKNYLYGINNEKKAITINKGDRHPTSIIDIENTILEYKNPYKPIHRTQKPVDLLEWLIKTYSNEKDTVMDFCMGSGTCGVACKNLNRKFIGVEKEKDMFDKAKKRIDNITV